MVPLRIEIWSDIACPWCYVGKRRLEGALAQFAHRDAVKLTWRAFELNPSAPREETDGSYVERLAKKYRTSASEAQGMITRMCDVAQADGLKFDFEHIRPGNTFDAHRLLHLAHVQGVQDAVKERFFRGYLVEGRAIGDRAALAEMATDAGLKPELVRDVLDSDTYAADVRADEREAQELGIHGVPFFVLAGRYAVSGAQSSEQLLLALEQAHDAVLAQPTPYAEGAACGPDGC